MPGYFQIRKFYFVNKDINLMKLYRFIIFLFFFLFFVFILFQSKWHRIKSNYDLPQEIKYELVNLASMSLKYSDVPVGSILVYKDQIVGKGFNTVLRDSTITGHAEINALNMALKSFGYQKFMDLDRAQLTLYTTFDPCEMCMGTLEHYNIRKIVYLKEKSLSHWINQEMKSIYYKLNKRKANGAEIQDSLFLLHPNYPLR